MHLPSLLDRLWPPFRRRQREARAAATPASTARTSNAPARPANAPAATTPAPSGPHFTLAPSGGAPPITPPYPLGARDEPIELYHGVAELRQGGQKVLRGDVVLSLTWLPHPNIGSS
jgi:hypothetical protein